MKKRRGMEWWISEESGVVRISRNSLIMEEKKGCGSLVEKSDANFVIVRIWLMWGTQRFSVQISKMEFPNSCLSVITLLNNSFLDFLSVCMSFQNERKLKIILKNKILLTKFFYNKIILKNKIITYFILYLNFLKFRPQ